MNNFIWTGLVAGFLFGVLGMMTSDASGEEAKGKSKGKIVHSVFFSLKDNSPAAQKKLVDACNKYLSGHPGTVFFAAGGLAKEFDRPVNDRDFDVALLVVFQDRAAHDKYQKDPRHLKFIEENKETWKKVRVFDSRIGD